MKINEIDYSAGTGKLQVDHEFAISKAKDVGTIDNHKVMRYDHKDQYLLFFSTDQKIDAYLLIVGNDIRGMENISGTPGLITALVAFAVKKYGPMTFTAAEPFTPEGFGWLRGFIENKGRGMKVTDQNGDFPDLNILTKEWNQAMTSSGHGPTSITISEGFHRQFDSDLLQPRSYYIHHTGTL